MTVTKLRGPAEELVPPLVQALLGLVGGTDLTHKVGALVGDYAQAHLLEVVIALKKEVDREKLKAPKHALAIAEVAELVASHGQHPILRGWAWWARGNALYHASEAEQALAAYRKAESCFDGVERAILLNNQVAALRELGRYAEALDFVPQARSWCQQAGPAAQRYLGLLAMNEGAVRHESGDFEHALRVYEEGRHIFAHLQDEVEAARIDINRDNVLEELDQSGQAEVLYQQALEVLQRHHCQQEVARVYLNLGKLARRQGQYQAALHRLDLAYQGFEAVANALGMATARFHRSSVLSDLNLLEEVILQTTEALQVFREKQALWQQARTLVNQGVAYRRQGLFPEAEQAFHEARHIWADQGAQNRLLTLDLERAFLALEAGDVPRALALAHYLEAWIDAAPSPTWAARHRLLLAQVALTQPTPDLSQGQQRAEQALQIATAHSLFTVEIEANHLLARCAAHIGDWDTARHFCWTAINAIERLRHLLSVDELRMGFMDDKRKLYQDVVRLSQHHATCAETFYTLNLAHNAPLLRLTPLNIDPSLSAMLQTWRHEWNWYQNKLENPLDLFTPHDRTLSADEAQTIRHKLITIESRILELVRAVHLNHGHPMPMGLTDGLGPPTPARTAAFLADIQAALGPLDMVLHYFVLDDQVQVLLVPPQGHPTIVSLGAYATLQKYLAPWRYHISDLALIVEEPQSALRQARQILGRLYTQLFAPLEPALTHCQSLFLVLPPDWHDLPIAALWDGQAHLATRFAFAHLSAPEALLRPRPSFQAAPHPQALLVGYSANGQLPFVSVGVDSISQALEARWQVHRLLDQEATLANVRTASQRCHLLHITSHAIYRPDNPLFSWVLLADGCLTVADVSGMSLPQHPFVVLSACETGHGRPRGGGLMGMGRGFLAAGASGLIVSLWKISDEATATVMASFYTALMPNACDPAIALQTAQCQALSQPHHAHPFFWAGFAYIRG